MKTVIAKALFDLLQADKNLFARQSMNLISVQDGYEVVTLCRAGDVGMAILAQEMVGVSGLSVCRAIKQIKKGPLVLVVVDQPEDADLVKSLEQARCDQILRGPVTAKM